MDCVICYSNCDEPLMCPQCNAVGCNICFKKWLVELHNNSCPQCRMFLTVDRLVNCKFLMNKLKESWPDRSQRPNNHTRDQRILCHDHSKAMTYYCQTCKKRFCSDCSIVSKRHQDHSCVTIEKIETDFGNKLKAELKRKEGQVKGVFKEISVVNDMISASESTYECVSSRGAELQCQIEHDFDRAKQGIENYISQCQTDLNLITELKNKLLLNQFISQRQLLLMLDEVERGCAELDVPRDYFRSAKQELLIKASEQLVPEYQLFEVSICTIEASADGYVYSDNFQLYSLTWRLKCYPNGNPSAAGSLSVFLELVNCPECFSQEFDYSFILTPLNENSREVRFTGTSEFAKEHCWGYNNFLNLNEVSDYVGDGSILKFVILIRNVNRKDQVELMKNYYEELKNTTISDLNCQLLSSQSSQPTRNSPGSHLNSHSRSPFLWDSVRQTTYRNEENNAHNSSQIVQSNSESWRQITSSGFQPDEETFRNRNHELEPERNQQSQKQFHFLTLTGQWKKKPKRHNLQTQATIIQSQPTWSSLRQYSRRLGVEPPMPFPGLSLVDSDGLLRMTGDNQLTDSSRVGQRRSETAADNNFSSLLLKSIMQGDSSTVLPLATAQNQGIGEVIGSIQANGITTSRVGRQTPIVFPPTIRPEQRH